MLALLKTLELKTVRKLFKTAAGKADGRNRRDFIRKIGGGFVTLTGLLAIGRPIKAFAAYCDGWPQGCLYQPYDDEPPWCDNGCLMGEEVTRFKCGCLYDPGRMEHYDDFRVLCYLSDGCYQCDNIVEHIPGPCSSS